MGRESLRFIFTSQSFERRNSLVKPACPSLTTAHTLNQQVHFLLIGLLFHYALMSWDSLYGATSFHRDRTMVSTRDIVRSKVPNPEPEPYFLAIVIFFKYIDAWKLSGLTSQLALRSGDLNMESPELYYCGSSRLTYHPSKPHLI